MWNWVKTSGSWARNSGQSRLFLTGQCLGAPVQPRQHVLPQEKGRMAGGRASLFWPLLPKMEEQVLRYNRQMCNTSCEEWWGGRGPAKFVVLCGMVPGQFPLASQKQPALHKNTSCLSSTQESTFLPVSYTTMAFAFPCMPCLAPFNKKHPKGWVLRHTGHPWWELPSCTERTRMASRWTQNTSCLLTGI